jgi:hypothetical protein
MKKFVARGFCFAAIGLALLCLLNFFYVRTNGYKSLDGVYKLNALPENIQVMNLGSSHGEFGLDYSGIVGLTGFNFGLRGQSLYLDLQMLKKYRDRLDEGCVVIIPLSYFTFLQAKDHSNQHILYYKYLDYGSIPNHSLIEYVKFKLLPILSASFNAKYLIKDKRSVEPELFLSQGADEEFYKKTAKEHSWLYHLFVEENKKRPHNEENAETLGEIIKFCRENGFKPVLITTPFTNYYNIWYTDRIYSEFIAAINEVCEKHDVPYLDYSHDPRFANRLEWFSDSDHLSPEGRKVFTEILLRDIGLAPELTVKEASDGQ